MDQINIECIAVKDITVRHEYLPRKEAAAQKYSILLKSEGPQIHVYRNQYGELLLIKGGIDAYNALMVIHPDKRIPAYVIDKEITELDWTFTLLHSCFHENIYFMVNYEYTMHLLEETNEDVKRICAEVGCSTEVILKYKIDKRKRVPDKYKKLAFDHKRQTLVNELCRNPKFTVYSSLLYKVAFQTSNRLTQEKLSAFQQFIDSGHHINVNSPDALIQLNIVVDKKQAFTTHWDGIDNRNKSKQKKTNFTQIINKENNSIRIKLK